ncbi:UPF0202 protein KRE33 [Zancudomyces culisetae]|uniref:UPF0202 protein KRE33 n=1 Tax=Zancudomyces culisetae TaxID=1213189 RepID=A0A1R1PQP4_ZANCU|nr:UPF0202 protein KRE33 [Zancudomyces culisetae]|eukprot:OMH83278.1 UPF0202 protein KRE33 [Zancudomyces culisetae]
MKSMDEIGDGHKGGSSDQNGKNNLVVRINVFREHRQTIQYVMPQDSHMLSQAELVVIDEAAAIPLPLVSKLLGPYLVFMASTINGYEGTGRSLSLKLIKQLREQRVGGDKTRQLKEERLDEPIRYSMNDGVEKWLNKLLCLQMDDTHMARGGIPHPSKCELFKINRDKLFSYHPVSERVLQKMVGLMTSSHYKNTPNDIQLMSDAPAHELYVLLAPQQEQQQQQQANGGSGSGSGAIQLPEPLVVIQVCLEGQISRKTIMSNLSRGIKSAGDLIPWLVSQQFQDSNFASLSGARIVRIATHPDYCGMGYGSRALSLLYDFYSFKFVSLSDTPSINSSEPLFASLSQIKPPTTTVTNAARVRIGAGAGAGADGNGNGNGNGDGNGDGQTEQPLIRWVGTSFGLTNQLFKFWTSKNLQYRPIYLRQTKSDLTGEHTVVMLKTLNESDDWLSLFCADFLTRFLTLLSYDFSAFDPLLALRIHQSTSPSLSLINSSSSRPFVLGDYFSPYDLKRLESYSNNILDYHVITDLFPTLAHLYFSNKLAALPDPISLSGTQQAVLLAFGLQHSPVELIASKLNCSESVVLALLLKIIKKFVTFFNSLLANESLNNTTTTTTSTTSNSTTTSSITESSNTSGPTLGSNTIVSLKQSPTTQPQPSSTKDSKSVSQSLLESENKLVWNMPSSVRNSSSATAPGASILFPNTRNGTFCNSSIANSASSSALASANRSRSAESTINTIADTSGK